MSDIFKEKKSLVDIARHDNAKEKAINDYNERKVKEYCSDINAIASYLPAFIALAIEKFYKGSIILATNSEDAKKYVSCLLDDIGIYYIIKENNNFYNHTSDYSSCEFAEKDNYESANFVFYLTDIAFKHNVPSLTGAKILKDVVKIQAYLKPFKERNIKLDLIANDRSNNYDYVCKLESVLESGPVLKSVGIYGRGNKGKLVLVNEDIPQRSSFGFFSFIAFIILVATISTLLITEGYV